MVLLAKLEPWFFSAFPILHYNTSGPVSEEIKFLYFLNFKTRILSRISVVYRCEMQSQGIFWPQIFFEYINPFKFFPESTSGPMQQMKQIWSNIRYEQRISWSSSWN